MLASSHFSRATSAPPVFKDLEADGIQYAIKGFRREYAYPAREPPTQDRVAGEKAGALPALARALSDVGGGGDGLFKMAK